MQRTRQTEPEPSTNGMGKPVQRGFTAIELMVVIAILAVLASLAAPSFRPLMERWRVRQTVDGLQSALYYARSEAVRRGGGVVLEKLPQGHDGCTLAPLGADWGCGWVIYQDSNRNGQLDNGEELKRMEAAAGTTVTRTFSGSSAHRIRLDRWGNMNGFTAMGFVIAPHPSGIPSPATRGLCVAAGGRIRIVPQEQVPCRA